MDVLDVWIKFLMNKSFTKDALWIVAVHLNVFPRAISYTCGSSVVYRGCSSAYTNAKFEQTCNDSNIFHRTKVACHQDENTFFFFFFEDQISQWIAPKVGLQWKIRVQKNILVHGNTQIETGTR